MKSSVYFLIISILLLSSGCHKKAVVDGRTAERFWLSTRNVKSQLSPEDIMEFQFALVAIRKNGLTEDEILAADGFWVDDEYLKVVHGKTAREIIDYARSLDGLHMPTKESGNQ